MVELIKDPLKDKFYNLIRDCKTQIRLCAPYVKEPIIKNIYDNKKPGVKLDIISNFSMPNFYKRSSDIGAFKNIINNKDKVYNCQILHAKFYIFDDKYTIITSSNLTHSGLERNLEYGVFVENEKLVSQTVEDYYKICKNSTTGKIDSGNIKNIQKILKSLPKYEELKVKSNYNNELDYMLNIDINLIKDNLSGWQKMIFEIIESIDSVEFVLSDIYKYERVISINYPQNNTIRDSIRRNLQELRDLGLIKFYGDGTYKKLWY